MFSAQEPYVNHVCKVTLPVSGAQDPQFNPLPSLPRKAEGKAQAACPRGQCIPRCRLSGVWGLGTPSDLSAVSPSHPHPADGDGAGALRRGQVSVVGLEDAGHRGAPGSHPLGGSHMGRDRGKQGLPRQAATDRQEGGSRPGNLRKPAPRLGLRKKQDEACSDPHPVISVTQNTVNAWPLTPEGVIPAAFSTGPSVGRPQMDGRGSSNLRASRSALLTPSVSLLVLK